MKLDLGVDVNKVISEAVTDYVSNNSGIVKSQIKSEVISAVEDLKPTQITVPKISEVVLKKSCHNIYKDVLSVAQIEKQLFLYGPAGSGKTTLASDVAKGLDMDFAHISCSAGMSEGHLLGRMLFNGEYVPSEFVRIYENGGVFLFDEIDAADANTLLVINSALANGKMSVPNRRDKPTAERHPDFICIVAGNTLGQGDSSYTGRSYMDAAFIDRFALSKFNIDYDEKLEKTICGSKYKDIYNMLSGVRGKIERNRLNRVVSTRAFVSAVKLKKAGYTTEQIINKITVGWTDEEVKKCFPRQN